MLQETDQSAEVVSRILEKDAKVFAEIAGLFERSPVGLVTTSARGSSANAASFFMYLMEIVTGVPVARIEPSVSSVYGAQLNLRGSIHFTVSQSGASVDILAVQAMAKKGGATTVAVVNATDSPLAREADIVLALEAGEERSVAATKSFVASVAALSGVVAHASRNMSLLKALSRLPEALLQNQSFAQSEIEEILLKAGSVYTLGRGTGSAIASEAALKAKETANIHAEAFSLAEVMHGPMRLIKSGFPMISFVPNDAALQSNIETLRHFHELGADLISFTNAKIPGRCIGYASTGDSLLDPLVPLLDYYRLIESVTRRKGFDPDKPPHLNKVTVTL